MCGIAGILRTDGLPADEAVVARMVAAMPHRGPDGRGAWHEGPIALGHALLAVRDEGPASAQPLVATDGAGVLVYNGEVYGEEALRDDLAREGVPPAGLGDAPVVLGALARWGVARTVARLDGMFAFAWWDARERALWLVRDRFGVKPLVVALGPGFLAFASEIRGLRVIEGLAARPDALEVARRLVAGPVDEARPPFEGVECVGPGEAWRCGARGVERRVWADPARDVDLARTRALAGETPDAWEARVEEALVGAVRSHLASVRPVAVFSSGGVDSNLVAWYAQRERPGLPAYTVDTLSPESEAEAAEEMARHTGVALRRVAVTREAHLRAWPEAVAALEQPTLHPSHVELLLLARAARADGVVVALTGEGADEVFGGYDFFLRTRTHWARAARPWARLGRARRERRRALEASPFRYRAGGGHPDALLRVAACLAPAEEARGRALLARFRDAAGPADAAFLAHAADALRRYLGWILLRHDRLGMASSLEARVPFLSRAVADLALHLPARAKARAGAGKWVLKRLAARRLPRRLVWARKKGFPVPEGHDRGTTALLRGGFLADLLRWTAEAAEDLVPRIEASPGLRHSFVGAELWGRLFFRGERASDLGERLRAAGGHR